ncbi:MAG: 8-oxo-dGTP diphosphatase [Bacillota bacterium]|nr:8-oxo-dGTP diphosphatase [Bacillota bacterium]
MINTTLCYIERDDEYLMLHRVKKENDINKDKWIGLGGKFEENESPEECLLREVYEESGLRLTSWRYRGIVTFVNTKCASELMHLFTADAFEGEIGPCDEGELEWIKKSELMRLTLWEGDKIFLRLLDSDEPFFSLKLCYDGDELVSAKLNGRNI